MKLIGWRYWDWWLESPCCALQRCSTAALPRLHHPGCCIVTPGADLGCQHFIWQSEAGSAGQSDIGNRKSDNSVAWKLKELQILFGNKYLSIIYDHMLSNKGVAHCALFHSCECVPACSTCPCWCRAGWSGCRTRWAAPSCRAARCTRCCRSSPRSPPPWPWGSTRAGRACLRRICS